MAPAPLEIRNVRVLNPQGPISNPIELEIQFEALQDINDEVEFVVLFNATGDKQGDQELDKIVVGPIPKGPNQFSFPTKNVPVVEADQDVDTGIILIRISLKGSKFCQVGFFVSIQKNAETDEITRDVLATKPRITNFDLDE